MQRKDVEKPMNEVLEHRYTNVVYYILGIIEALLGLRLLFRLLGANPASGFVSMLYALTRVFTIPFQGIFSTVRSSGSVFEPATAVAMVIYALIAYGIVRLIRLR